MINVMVIDDSKLVRTAFETLIGKAADINLIACAEDPIDALPKLKQQWPDVIILDIEMPRIDGLTFLEKIMKEKPTPVIICSTLTSSTNSVTARAFSLGAAAVMGKPAMNADFQFNDASSDVIQTIRSLSKVDARKLTIDSAPQIQPNATPSAPVQFSSRIQLIVLGSSTGGPQALESVVPYLPTTIPPMAIVQHMPPGFTAMLAARLDSLSECNVVEATDGLVIERGMIAIAPGGMHLELTRKSGPIQCIVKDGPLVNRHKPSVDVLFKSAEREFGSTAIGVVLTGMGNDGARGAEGLHNAGAKIIAQDEATSVVFGMPKEVIALNSADLVSPLNRIANDMLTLLKS